MLAVGTGAQAASAVMVHGPAFLIPTLHRDLGYSLAEAGLVAAAPTIGVMLTLVLWGLVVDRRGERFALLTGLTGATLAGAAGALTHSVPLLAVALGFAGAASACTNAASGRVVVGWFPPHRRGLAMGVRQMAQPVGVGIAAIGIAVVADRFGVSAAIWLPTALIAVAGVAVALVVLDPPRPERTRETAPTRTAGTATWSGSTWSRCCSWCRSSWCGRSRSAWLVQDRDWSPAAAGTVVALAQVVGAFSRLGVGQLSDVVGGRMRPLRWVTWAAIASMLALGATAGLDWGVAVLLMVVATAVTVADNGLAFTAVAERAGPFWSGRALGIQNTAQFLGASLVPPLVGLGVSASSYPAAFAAAAIFPLLAAPLVPVREERDLT